MQLQPEASVISDRKKFPTTVFVLVLTTVCTISIITVVSIKYSVTNKNYASKEDEEIARLITEAQNVGISFTAVPNAPERIDIPAPYDTSDSDNKNYLQLKPESVVSEEIVQNDVIFNMPFMGVTYGTYQIV